MRNSDTHPARLATLLAALLVTITAACAPLTEGAATPRASLVATQPVTPSLGFSGFTPPPF